MIDPAYETLIAQYIKWFETISPQATHRIKLYVSKDVRFRDPFNDVMGADAVVRVFDHMFATTDDPVFKVYDVAWGRDGRTVYLRWDFLFSPKGRNVRWSITGMSEVMIDLDGRICSHIDHWDSQQLFNHSKLLNGLLGFVRAKLKA